MTATRLLEIYRITAEIEVETGLHIGGSSETMEISGIDNPILRNASDNLPYIPGSSLKGKLRSLSEWASGDIPPDGNASDPQAISASARVFGIPARNPKANATPEEQETARRGPTRVVVRDAFLTPESRQAFVGGKPLTEVKTENSINRLTSMANPRPLERVLPGVRFNMEILYKIFDVDGDGGQGDRQRFESVLVPALALLEADALGGAVSRGCGKIRFEKLQNNGQDFKLPTLSSALTSPA